MNLYVVALTEDVERHLSVLKHSVKIGTIDRLNIHRQVSEYIQFHSDAKQLRKQPPAKLSKYFKLEIQFSFQIIFSIMEYFVGFLQPMFIVVFLWST